MSDLALKARINRVVALQSINALCDPDTGVVAFRRPRPGAASAGTPKPVFRTERFAA